MYNIYTGTCDTANRGMQNQQRRTQGGIKGFILPKLPWTVPQMDIFLTLKFIPQQIKSWVGL